MSTEQEQVTTPQNDEVSKVQSSEAEAVVEKPVSSPEVTNGEQVVAEEESNEVVSQQEVSLAEDKDKAPEEKKEDSDKNADSEVVQPKPQADANGANIEEANGNGKEGGEDKVEEPKPDEPVVEETNGICKRKAEDSAEAAEEEKTPKKAKTLEQDGDKAPVEETAA